MKKSILFLVFSLVPMFVFSQFAGEEIHFKVNKESKKHQSKSNSSSKKEIVEKRKSIQKKTKVVSQPQIATYLKVNNQTTLEKQFDVGAGLESFYVSTDGKTWDIYLLPPWCRVTNKLNNSFILAYDENPKHFDRKNWFVVRSDNQTVRINLTQLGRPINISAKINAIGLEQNVHTSKYNSLYANLNVSIKGANGLECTCILFITDENGNAIMANDPKYSLDGVAGLTANITPLTDDESIYNIRMEIPHYILTPIKKKKVYKLNVGLVYNNKYISSIVTVEFIAKKNKRKAKNGVIKTELTKRQESINLIGSIDKNVYKPYTIRVNPRY